MEPERSEKPDVGSQRRVFQKRKLSITSEPANPTKKAFGFDIVAIGDLAE